MREKLLNKAKKHDLNVEDIIEISHSRSPDMVKILLDIKKELGWISESILHDNGNITPPMGMWVDAACIFIRDGYKGLIDFSKKTNQAEFAIAFLQEYKTVESVSSLLSIGLYYLGEPEKNKEILIKITGALNLILSFSGAPNIDEADCEQARVIIHKCLSLCTNQSEIGSVICALRGVGNEESIKLISALPKLENEWEGTEKIVTKAIRKRSRKV